MFRRATRLDEDSEAIEIAFYLLGRLQETQRENSQLRLELNRSRVQLQMLQGRLDMRVRQLRDLVTSIREFVRLYRRVRATAGDGDTEELRRSFSRVVSLDRVGDIDAETRRNSVTTTVSLSRREDWIDLEEDEQRPHSSRQNSLTHRR
ncbi:unnamed protein product [Phytophthora fragariaefolia]|uniref:Unnamed protein product n=1 Tax=Phytophthora fragariaefolia TaxID=1490495 RepID=A0A9W6U409_9STRA|nr:unnamed protein product [Phytophthora fragariaefolia]